MLGGNGEMLYSGSGGDLDRNESCLQVICFFHYRTKRRTDKQYHSDDGYTSDPGIIREVSGSLIPSPWCMKPSIIFSLVKLNSICTNTKSWVSVVFCLYIYDQHSE